MLNPFQLATIPQAKSSSADPKLADDVGKIYEFISEHLYLGRPDLSLGRKRYNATLLYSLATALVGGNALILGEPGLGKTTSAEYVSALCYGLPLQTVIASQIHGSPEETAEKMIARPDLGELMMGTEKVRWQHFTYLPTKIVDEVNRLPESKQNLLLDGVDRGVWRYLNESLVADQGCGFFTANYPDKGTVTITPPLMDRFDVSVESKYMGANLASRIALSRNGAREILRCQPKARQISQLLEDPNLGFERKVTELANLSREVGEYYQQRFGAGLSWDRLRDARLMIEEIPFQQSADAYLRFLLSELSFHDAFGQVRSNEEQPPGNHYERYLCAQVKNCSSQRLANAAVGYARALAFLDGAEQVGVRHLQLVFPYALSHRTRWRERYLKERGPQPRPNKDHRDLHIAKKAVEEVSERFDEQKDYVLETLTQAAKAYPATQKERVTLARKIKQHGDHPLYQEIVRDLISKRR